MTIRVNYQPRNATIPIDRLTEEITHDMSKSVINEKKTVLENFPKGKAINLPRTPFLILTGVSVTAFALTMGVDVVEAATTLTTEEMDVLKQIDEILFKIQLICGGISVGLAVVMAMVSGFFRMLGLREEAKKRYQDAVAGMTMVLTAPVVLGVIATVVRGLIKLFPNYGI